MWENLEDYVYELRLRVQFSGLCNVFFLYSDPIRSRR